MNNLVIGVIYKYSTCDNDCQLFFYVGVNSSFYDFIYNNILEKVPDGILCFVFEILTIVQVTTNHTAITSEAIINRLSDTSYPLRSKLSLFISELLQGEASDH